MATVRTTCEIYRHKFIVLLYSPLQLCNEVRLAAVAVTVTVDVAAAVPPCSCCCCCLCCCYFEVVLGMLLLFRWLRALLRSLLRFRFIRFTFSARILCIHVLHIFTFRFTFIRRFAFVLIKFCKFDTINCHCHCCSCCYTCCCCCCNCRFYLQINAIV